MNEPAHELEGVAVHGILYAWSVDAVGPLAPQFTPRPRVTTKVSSLWN